MIKKKNPYIFYVFYIFLLITHGYGQDNDVSENNSTDQPKDKVIPKEWYRNGNIISEIKLDELRKNNSIYILNEPSEKILELFLKDKKKKIEDVRLTKDIYIALETIKKSENPVINQLLNQRISSNNQLLKEKIGDILELNQFLKNTNEEDKINWSNLVKVAPKGSIIIENIDLAQSLQISKREIDQNIIEMNGRIKIHYGNNTVSANKVIFNIETQYFTALGNIIVEGKQYILKGDKFIFNVKEQMGAVDQPRGKVEDIYVKGRLATINNENFYTVFNTTATFDIERPIFFISAQNATYFGDKKITMNNAILKVHNFPFFYTPYFLQDPFGTSIHLRYGYTQREGIYVQSKLNFFIPYLNDININFDYYQKLGSYFKIQNKQQSSFQDYDIQFAFANFYDGFYRNEIYNNYYGPELKSSSYFRAKLAYDHTFNLTKKELREKNINTTININLKKTIKTDEDRVWTNNDPYFTKDYEDLTPRYITLDQLIRTDPYSESQRIPNASDKDYYGFTIGQSIPNSTIQIKTNINYGLEARNKLSPDFERKRYFQYLNNIVVPDINFKYSGVIDPLPIAKNDSDNNKETIDNKTLEDFFKRKRKYYAKIDYSITSSYYHKMIYKVNQTEENEDFNYHENQYMLDFSLSRLFKLEKNIHNTYLKAFNAEYKVTLGNKYQQRWGGQGLDINSDNQTNNEQNTFDKIYFNNNLTIYLPSKHYYNIFSNRLGYWPMIPLTSLNISYNVVAREDLKESDRKNLDYKPFNYLETHNIKATPKIEQNGFGLFFIPYLNYKQSATMVYEQSFKPHTKQNGVEEKFKYYPLSETYQPFIVQWNLNYKLNVFLEISKLSYKPIELIYSYTFNILDSGTKTVVNDSLVQKFELNFNYKDEDKNKIAYINLFNFKLRYNYYFQEKDYLQDSIDLITSFKFTIIKYLQVEFGTLTGNERAFLYLKKKANAYGYDKLSLFRDIGNSILFVGNTHQDRLNNQEKSNFKLKKVYLSLYHDLQTWFLKLTYSATPKTIDTNNTVKGYYFNHSIYIDIAMKDKFFLSEYVNSAILPWETKAIPRALDFIGTQ